jgi:hypothetical protein
MAAIGLYRQSLIAAMAAPTDFRRRSQRAMRARAAAGHAGPLCTTPVGALPLTESKRLPARKPKDLTGATGFRRHFAPSG